MKHCPWIFAALLLSAVFCLAQEKPRQSSNLNEPSLRWFEDDANSHGGTLLFKSLEYAAPYSGLYFELILDKEGNAFMARVVPNWAVQGSRRGKLSAGQLEEVRRMLAAPYFRSTPSPMKPKSGERYTAFVFLRGSDYARYDYSGPLPAEVREAVEFVSAEIERQEALRLEKWFEEQKRKTQSDAPPELGRQD
jgi:hypothetical protein